MTLEAGKQLGPYEILEPIGAGGMGEVYKARDTRLDRVVAIKVLPGHLSASPDLRQRFEREARAISSLNHPHICQLYDVGREGEVDYLVMEFLEGESLATRLERGPLPMRELLETSMQIADALDGAHRQGFVHRDLKPGNVMMTPGGAKLLDFGLARAATPPTAGDDSAHTPTMSHPLTAEGSIVGTFQYMAPEQLEGKEADGRTDIFAFGMVLYEMATGTRAFAGGTQASLVASIFKDEPRPLSERQPMAPPALERIVQTCLAKDPERRYQSAHDLKLHLEWVAEGGSQAGLPVPVAAKRRFRDRLTVAVAILSTVLLIPLTAGFFLRPQEERPVVRFQIPQPENVRFADTPQISPDGKHLAYNAADSAGTMRLWLRPLSALEPRTLPGTDGAGRPFWSPDSRFLAFFAGGKLKKVEITGAPPAVICDAPTGADGSWGRKGVILFDGRASDPIWRVPATGGIPTPEILADTVSGVSVGWPEFLPDGEHFFYLSLGAESRLLIAKLGEGVVSDLGPSDSRVRYSDSGHLVYSRGGTLVCQPFDAGRKEWRGEPVPLAERVPTTTVGAADFSVSRNGVLAFSRQGAGISEVVEFDREGRRLRVVSEPADQLYPVLSPDERRLALRVMDPQTRTRDIWVLDLRRRFKSRFTFDPGNENEPLWTPDGSRIAYTTNRSSAPGIHWKNASGTQAGEPLLPTGENVSPQDWSPDGRLLIYESFASGSNSSSDIWVYPVGAGSDPYPYLAAPHDQNQARLSPDGSLLVFTSDESGRNEVYLESFPERGGKWQVSTRGGFDAHWRADGAELYYLSPDGRMMAVSVGRNGPELEIGESVALFPVRPSGPTWLRNHYDVTADGSRFYVAVPAEHQERPVTYIVMNWTEELASR